MLEPFGDRKRRQRSELDSPRLSEQGAAAIPEQLSHQRWLAPSEHVGADAVMVLDVASKDAVDIVDGAQQILEFVEHDQTLTSGALVHLAGNLEADDAVV